MAVPAPDPDPPETEEEAETQMQDALDASDLDDVYVRMERNDGTVLTLTKGTPNERYSSQSTVKPIACAVIMWCHDKGYLDIDDPIADYLTEWATDAAAKTNLLDITFAQLMSFISGAHLAPTNPACADSSAGVWEDYVDCISSNMASLNDDEAPPVDMIYATDQHGLASAAAVRAANTAIGGISDWGDLVDAFIADTGHFSGLTWGTNPTFNGGKQVNYTAAEYIAFLRAMIVDRDLFSSTALCDDMIADATAANSGRTPIYSWFTGLGYTGEDWHFGRGIWRECRAADYTETPAITRYSTLGNAGSYVYHDTSTGVTLAVSVTFGSPDYMDGLMFARSIDSLVEAWAGFGS